MFEKFALETIVKAVAQYKPKNFQKKTFFESISKKCLRKTFVYETSELFIFN
jgi:hypothetical protein